MLWGRGGGRGEDQKEGTIYYSIRCTYYTSIRISWQGILAMVKTLEVIGNGNHKYLLHERTLDLQFE